MGAINLNRFVYIVIVDTLILQGSTETNIQQA